LITSAFAFFLSWWLCLRAFGEVKRSHSK
jgi:hypothetical protein